LRCKRPVALASVPVTDRAAGAASLSQIQLLPGTQIASVGLKRIRARVVVFWSFAREAGLGALGGRRRGLYWQHRRGDRRQRRPTPSQAYRCDVRRGWQHQAPWGTTTPVAKRSIEHIDSPADARHLVVEDAREIDNHLMSRRSARIANERLARSQKGPGKCDEASRPVGFREIILRSNDWRWPVSDGRKPTEGGQVFADS